MQSRFVCWFVVSVCLVWNSRSIVAEEPTELPAFAEIQTLVVQHFSEQSDLRPNDIICQNDVSALFPILEAAGWNVEDRDKLLQRMLLASDPLIGILRTPHGTKFMRQVAGEKLIYDRLDRVVREPGGQRMLTDLVKLPDAARYAKQKTQPGVPDLEDFLPKDRSGKTRRVKDYGKASERIYTVADFNKALQASYELAQRNFHTPG